MSNIRSKRIKKRNNEKNESIENFMSGNDEILNAFRFSKQNKVSLSLAYPEYFKPKRLCNSALPKTRISTFKTKMQYTVSTKPHCYIVFFPESVYLKKEIIAPSLTIQESSPTVLGKNQSTIVGLDGFDEKVILSSYVKINFTRSTAGYFEIAPAEYSQQVYVSDYDDKQKIGDDFIFRYILPNYNFEFKKQQDSCKCTIIHFYGLENGLVLDAEIVVTIQATPTAGAQCPYEFKKTTLRKHTHSSDMRMLKRLFENRRPELLNTPLKNPLNIVLDMPTESINAKFLFPDKNTFEIRNSWVIANFETDGKNIYAQDLINKDNNNLSKKDNNSISKVLKGALFKDDRPDEGL